MLTRHACDDWGDIDPDNRGYNGQAVGDGSRILSVYILTPGTRATIWIITQTGDRTATTILTSDES